MSNGEKLRHRVFLRLPEGAERAKFDAGDVWAGSEAEIAIDCDHDKLDELAMWLRRLADSLDGRIGS